MKQIKNWILLSTLILVTLTSYSQSVKYPITKRLGKDSVVVLTIDQADQINKKFLLQMDSIKTFKYKFDSTNDKFHIHTLVSAKKYDDLMHDYNTKWYENKDLEGRYDSAMKAIKIVQKRRDKNHEIEFWSVAIYAFFATILVGYGR